MTALNFPDSPSNGATYQGYTYNSTKGTWTKPAEQDARTAVYANIAALPTSGTAGDMAYVTSTNRLYLWTGTGWYNIALINNNPTISGVSATYDLAIDGTATTVTITATDPEGIPITYSIASDTSGNTATVTQGTGASTNVFTITPSTNTAHAGTFSLTFRASDGVNIASAAASFTLQFNVQNQKYTTALITSVGANNAVNNSFDDKSTNDHTITVNGDSHQTTFSPYRHGGHSIFFDGAEAIGVGVGSYSLDWSNGQTWTIEFWMQRQGSNPDGHIFMKYPGSGSNISGIRAYVSGSEGRIGLHYNSGTELTTAGTRVNIADGDWHHVAVTRGSGYFKIWVDGQLDATVSNSDADGMASSSTWAIGRHGSGTASAYLNDTLIRDFRIVGSEVYTANFTPPTESLTAISGTQILIANGLPYIKDLSGNATPLTYYGNPEVNGAGPHDKPEYVAATHLGSVHFDGTGDYLASDNNDIGNFGTGDFTLEGWFWVPDRSALYTVVDGRPTSLTSATGWSVAISTAGTLYVYTGGFHITGTAGAVTPRHWHHWALSRESGAMKLFLNGVQQGSTNSTARDFTANLFRVGASGTGGELFKGNQADVRVVKGTAVYTSNFTPPTAPLSAITNTTFLLHNTDAGIIDKAQVARAVKLIGNTKSSTTQTKFLSTSMYFDGTGDYIKMGGVNIGQDGSSDFTAEGWFYLTASPSNYITVVQTRASNASTAGWVMAISASDFYIYSGAHIVQKSSAISSNQWYHWAYSRQSGTHRLFLDGTLLDSDTTARNYTEDEFWIGAKYDASEYFTGYQSDVRMTHGLARYTANFTPPTAALKG
tara:strand:- start:702 stop:3185 length:2484 start_codon:yes stop_codon:yes gene_type:complete